ncbi:S53 family peptidase [Dactylosporangium sp. NPDC051485]|uniref:S53 family peptidase n=1 Tax=Dactylosporangium sp. NPDC051485 TaxID=3154846 RepID=UPI0034294306
MHVRTLATAVAAAAAALVVFPVPAHAAPVTPGGDAGVPPSAPVTVTLTLTGADESSMTAYAAQASSPGTGNYGHHLTRVQARTRFGAPADRVERVSRWAHRAGFSVVGLDATGSRLTVTGTARQARAAFGVTLRTQVRDGVRVRTATAVPKPPAAVRADVAAVSGLTTRAAKPLVARPAVPKPMLEGPYCSAFWGEYTKAGLPSKYPANRQSNILCGYNGAQLRALYGLGPNDRGQGQTVVVVGAFHNPSALADANRAFAENGVPPLPADRFAVKSYNLPGGATGCDQDLWHVEQALDIQAVHTIAPDARIVYAAAPDCTQLEETVAAVIADNAIDTTIVSASWGIIGEPADVPYLTATNNILARAAILGIGVYAASGDTGDNSSVSGANGPSVLFPASSPWTTAVGGTSSAVGPNNQVMFQTGWASAGNRLAGGGWQRLNPAFVGGAGGGPSHHFDKPSWQSGLPGERRVVPDISALADPFTGLHIGYTSGGQYRTGPVGGTSLAAPIVASLTAVAQSRAGGVVVGHAAPVMYAKAAAGRPIVTDVRHIDAGIWTPGINASTPTGDYLLDLDAGVQTLKTGPGYDRVTGLGVPGPGYLTELVS